MAVGFILLGISGVLLYLVVDGLVTGQIIKISRVNPGAITREDDPYEFWLSEIFFSYFIVFLLTLAGRTFWKVFKRRKR